MNTKIISRALLALALCTPLGVWAAGESNAEESCLATFSVSDQTLTLPCVEVVMGTETVLYSAQLQQVEEGRFALTQVAELSAAVESECVASYSLETGELGVPCVEEVNPPEVADMRALVFYAEEPGSPSVFVVGEEEAGMREIRANPSYTGNWSVPYLKQKSYLDIGESACGPTSTTMLLRFFYPNSNIDVPEVYHAGTQTYVYGVKGGPAHAYRNVSFPDQGLAIVSQQYRTYYTYPKGYDKFSGMTPQSMRIYLRNIWGLETKRTSNIGTVYNAIRSGPLLGHCTGKGKKYPLGHYFVIRGIDEKGTLDRGDDTIYINDPYDDQKGENQAVNYSTFLSRWFSDALQIIPRDTPEQRQYTVVVDTGNNNFEGNASANAFYLDDPSAIKADGTPVWRFYYGQGGDWYYPTEDGHAARWTPRLSQKGYYQVSVKFKGDDESGSVTYTIYSKDNASLAEVTVNQYKSKREWDYAILADSILLDNGDYVRASNIPTGTNVDAVKFKYLNADTNIPVTPNLPVITEVSPLEAKVNQPTNFTVKGSNLTAGMGFTIEHCEGTSAETADSKTRNSATERTFTCTPRLLGKWLVTVKDKPGGQVLTVSVAFQSVAVNGAEVVSISPLQAVLNQPTTFTVTGKNLTAGMGFSIQDCDKSSQEIPESLAANSATQRQFVCTPRGQIGGKTVTVKNFPDKTRPGLLIPEGYGVVQVVSTLLLIPPCSDCDATVGEYDRDWLGDGTNHLGKDYPGRVGDPVRAVADGWVVRVNPSVGGFGGHYTPDTPGRNNSCVISTTNATFLPGPMFVIQHRKEDGSIFQALYGHASTSLTEGQWVKAGDIVGQVESYLVGRETCRDGQQDWSHLHFGVWDSSDPFPTTQLSYGDIRQFVNPVTFLQTHQYQVWEAEN